MSVRETWFILGASSAIARAMARQVASSGCDVVLAGRDGDDLARNIADITACTDVTATPLSFDADNPNDRAALVTLAEATPGIINVAVLFGLMPPQSAIDADPNLALACINATFTSAAVTLHMLAPILEKRRAGCIIGVGSVAGDRGRLPNYVYGAAKAGFHTYLAGLRNRLGRAGVHVLTVKPGFVDTAMTWGLPGLFLVASPEDAASAMLHAAKRRRPIIYVPWFWRYIMLIIQHIPERIFMRLKI